MGERTEHGAAVEQVERAHLETVLAAWHEATVRLEKTHRSLQAEVRRLTEELEVKNRELARKNRLADLGQMASHVAHEVRNTLVPVKLYLSLLRRRVAGDAASAEACEKIAAGLTALEVTVNDLLHFTSDREPCLQRFPLAGLVEDAYTSLAPQLSAQGITMVRRVDEALVAVADRDMLRRALLNLVLNGIDAMPEGGQLEVSACATPSGLEIRVVDSGPGIPPEVAQRAFEPFFTTKRGGTGLGLAIVQRIAEVHGGRVTAENRAGGGALFTLRIPCVTQEAAA
ncbi:MAG TPA: sensor histidine kinase [Planctomycetes bacterium]|nr:sensor histidine kinase [Planctomycetota bacterium]